MKTRQIVVTAVTATVFAWSTVLVAVGETAAVAGLAPALALTVQQIVHASRSHPAPSTSNRLDAATDKEDDAP
ncbi:hypothetical protein ABZ016_13930 [Streptomyces sp. NPDC006372]|uniref:hypothetical protein n=1 Tax=Streptomyces sp. NPDC006372 TaxID=3155599 RepID=UPI0033AEF76B